MAFRQVLPAEELGAALPTPGAELGHGAQDGDELPPDVVLISDALESPEPSIMGDGPALSEIYTDDEEALDAFVASVEIESPSGSEEAGEAAGGIGGGILPSYFQQMFRNSLMALAAEVSGSRDPPTAPDPPAVAAEPTPQSPPPPIIQEVAATTTPPPTAEVPVVPIVLPPLQRTPAHAPAQAPAQAQVLATPSQESTNNVPRPQVAAAAGSTSQAVVPPPQQVAITPQPAAAAPNSNAQHPPAAPPANLPEPQPAKTPKAVKRTRVITKTSGGILDFQGRASHVNWRRRRCAFGTFFLLLIVLIGAGTIIVMSLSGDVKRALHGSDSFGNTCGDANIGASNRFTLDMTSRVQVLYMTTKSNALRICVESCTNTTGTCLVDLSPELLTYVDPIVLAENHLDSRGCRTDMEPAVAILNRCTPLNEKYPIDGLWIDIVATLMDGIARPLTWGIAILASITIPIIFVCNRRKGIFGDFVVATISTVTVGAYLAQWWFVGPWDPKSQTRRDKFNLETERHLVLGLSGFVGLLLLWVIARWLLTWTSTYRLGKHALRSGVGRLRRRAHLCPLLLAVVILLSIGSGVVYSWLATKGGCQYTPQERSNGTANLLVGWEYDCPSGLASYAVNAMPWAPIGLLVWVTVLLQGASRVYGARAIVHESALKRGGVLRHTLLCFGDLQWVSLVEIVLFVPRILFWVLLGPFENLRQFSLFRGMHWLLTSGRRLALKLAITGSIDGTSSPSLRTMQRHESRLGRTSARAGELFLSTGATTVLSFALGAGLILVEFTDGVSVNDSGQGNHSLPLLVLLSLLVTLFVTIIPFSAVQSATEAAGVMWCCTYQTGREIPSKVHRAVVDLTKKDFSVISLPDPVLYPEVPVQGLPGYWVGGGGIEVQRIPAPEMITVFQRIMTSSIPGGNCCSMRTVQIVKVERIESSKLWLQYATKRHTMQREYANRQPPGIRINAAHDSARAFLPVDERINEVMLFHGTKHDVVNRILKTGFDVNMAGSGLYGQGIYFAENACKVCGPENALDSFVNSKQYTNANGSGHRVMFYSRVLLGEHEAIIGAVPAGQGARRRPNNRADQTPYESIVADRRARHAGGQQKHREFIVFDNIQTYPEFLITFKCQ